MGDDSAEELATVTVRAMIDGESRVISRQATEELARAASRQLNASANPPHADDSDHPAR